jgi:hypothetical protein
MNPNIFRMPANAGLMPVPGALTADIRQLLSQTQGMAPGGLLTGGGGMPNLGQQMQLMQQYGVDPRQLQAYGGQQQIALALASDVPHLGLRAGQQIMLALQPADVHVAEEIDTFLAGYAPDEFRADEAVPIVPTDFLTDQFRTFTENNAFRVVNVLASTQSDINEVDPETILRTFICVDRAIGGFIPNVTQYTARKAYDPRQALARRIRWALALEREVRIFGSSGLLTTSANWNANNVTTIAGGSEWDTTNGDPIRNMQDAEENSIMPITDWFMSVPVFNAFLRNANVRLYFRQMLGDNAPSPDVVNRKRDVVIPGLAPIHVVGGKVLNESTGNIDYIMGEAVVGVRKPTGSLVNPEDIQTAVTWRFNGPSGTGFITREFELPRRGLHAGQMMVSGYSEDPRFIANNVGALILNTLA